MNHNIIFLWEQFFLLCRRVALQGSNAASGNSQNNTKQEDEDASLEVTPWMVVIFVILICGTLLLLFYFYNYLVYVVIVLFCLAACNGFYECMRPIVLWLPLGMNKVMLKFILFHTYWDFHIKFAVRKSVSDFTSTNQRGETNFSHVKKSFCLSDCSK